MSLEINIFFLILGMFFFSQGEFYCERFQPFPHRGQMGWEDGLKGLTLQT